MPQSTNDGRKLPLVALVGRPNVGKSTLFNRLVGERRAIVDSKPGSTRDRAYGRVEWTGREFSIVDTGGLDPGAQGPFLGLAREQADRAIEDSTLVLFVVDAVAGLLPNDRELARALRQTGRSVLLVVNKAEGARRRTTEFAELGFEDTLPISAEQGDVGDLLDRVVAAIDAPRVPETDPPERIRIAILGRPNVGKSSMLNRLTGERRAIVSEIAGTTRDAVDADIEWTGKPYTIVDTPGIRKVRQLDDGADHVAVVQARRAVERADVAVLMLSAEEGVKEMDATIGGLAQESGRAVVIAVNKWDRAKDFEQTAEKMREAIERRLKFLEFARVVFVSAKTGLGRKDLFAAIDHAWSQWSKRVPTGPLNRVLELAAQRHPLKMQRGSDTVNLLYGSQIRVRPPAFALSLNRAGRLHFASERYIENRIRAEFGFEGTPIRILARGRGRRRGSRS
jgi:GTP-binding protein